MSSPTLPWPLVPGGGATPLLLLSAGADGAAVVDDDPWPRSCSCCCSPDSLYCCCWCFCCCCCCCFCCCWRDFCCCLYRDRLKKSPSMDLRFPSLISVDRNKIKSIFIIYVGLIFIKPESAKMNLIFIRCGREMDVFISLVAIRWSSPTFHSAMRRT